MEQITQTEKRFFVDMTQEELAQEIAEQEDFVCKHCEPREWDLKKIAELKQDLEHFDKHIKEEFAEYKRKIKSTQERVKETKIKLVEEEKNIQETLKFKENQVFKLETLKSIKENLKLNPNYYKGVSPK